MAGGSAILLCDKKECELKTAGNHFFGETARQIASLSSRFSGFQKSRYFEARRRLCLILLIPQNIKREYLKAAYKVGRILSTVVLKGNKGKVSLS